MCGPDEALRLPEESPVEYSPGEVKFWKRTRLALGAGSLALFGATANLKESDLANYTSIACVTGVVLTMVSHSIVDEMKQ